MNLINNYQTISAFLRLENYGVLKVAGLDAKKFLQGQLTCDLEKITDQTSTLAAHCNPQGRVISLFYLCYFQEAYYLIMPSSLIPLTIVALKKYAVFSKVTINDASALWNIIGVVNIKNEFSAKIINISSEKINRHLVMVDHAEAEKFCLQLADHYKHIPHPDWHLLDIFNLKPTIYPETSAKFLPQELNLIHLGAVSFDKGCYTGQEIIARLHYRGKLKKRLYCAQITLQNYKPLLGEDVFQNTNHDIIEVGIIVDICEHNNKYFTLIILDDESAKKGNLFLKNDPDCFFEIEV